MFKWFLVSLLHKYILHLYYLKLLWNIVIGLAPCVINVMFKCVPQLRQIVDVEKSVCCLYERGRKLNPQPTN